MSTYNLNDNVKNSFQFELGGYVYEMRYPTVEETEQIQKAVKQAEAEDNQQPVLDTVYGLITSPDDKAPDIKDVLPKQNIKVLQNFTNMIKTEFSGDN